MFIVFEGIDGSGKSTQAKLLCQVVAGSYLTAEPTDSPIGKLIRDRLYSGDTDMHVMRRLFAADRQDHVNNTILPVLSEGGVVVSDRYLVSSMAYQSDSLGLQNQLNDILKINEQGRKLPVPDLTIYIDMLPEQIMGRLAERGQATDSFETLDHLTRVREKYEAAISRVRKIGWDVAEISGDGSPEYVHGRILQVLQSRLGESINLIS